MKRVIISTFFAVFFLLSCNNVTEIRIDKKLANLKTNDTINTSDLDTLYLIKPYQQIEPNKYSMPKSLFIKNGKIVNYLFVPRRIVDFTTIYEGKEKFPSDQVYNLNEERQVVIPKIISKMQYVY